MSFRSSKIDRASFEQATGWELKDQTACKGDICIPLAAEPGVEVDLHQISAEIGLPLVSEPEHELWTLGSGIFGAHTLSSAKCPDLVLPDLEGREFDLSSLLGQKVLVYAWAPY